MSSRLKPFCSHKEKPVGEEDSRRVFTRYGGDERVTEPFGETMREPQRSCYADYAGVL